MGEEEEEKGKEKEEGKEREEEGGEEGEQGREEEGKEKEEGTSVGYSVCALNLTFTAGYRPHNKSILRTRAQATGKRIVGPRLLMGKPTHPICFLISKIPSQAHGRRLWQAPLEPFLKN